MLDDELDSIDRITVGEGGQWMRIDYTDDLTGREDAVEISVEEARNIHDWIEQHLVFDDEGTHFE